jgi:hypothetical protein
MVTPDQHSGALVCSPGKSPGSKQMMPKIACTCGHIVIANTLRLPRELR